MTSDVRCAMCDKWWQTDMHCLSRPDEARTTGWNVLMCTEMCGGDRSLIHRERWET